MDDEPQNIHKKDFSKIIVDWYEANKRDLPWRETKDPFKIWLSEIILQQTRVNQGMPYYEKFVEAYSTVIELANDEESNVLRLWQGLGYYSRARNLHAAAKYVANELNGEFPNTYESLLKLKGVGSYTAAAIASFAFNEKVAPVDGNVIRVLSRVFGITEDVSKGSTLKKINQLANELVVEEENAQSYNQGMMEFGAMQCVPKSPKCETCPIAQYCYALRHNKIDQLPRKDKKIKKRNRFFNYIVFEHKDKFYLRPRTGKDIWTGLYEFALIESTEEKSTEWIIEELQKELKTESFKVKDDYVAGKHVLSHQNLFSRFIKVELSDKLSSETFGVEAFSLSEIEQLPKSILINNYLEKNIFS